jgi:hypothetical protein
MSDLLQRLLFRPYKDFVCLFFNLLCLLLIPFLFGIFHCFDYHLDHSACFILVIFAMFMLHLKRYQRGIKGNEWHGERERGRFHFCALAVDDALLLVVFLWP